MADLNTLFAETQQLDCKIKSILRLSTYEEYDDLSGLDVNYEDAQQLFLLDELRGIMEKLSDVHDRITYLSRPVKETGRLHRNGGGRYETAHGHYYTSGSRIEALVTDGSQEAPYWVRTSVEHDGRDYYLVGHKNIHMDGLTVRVREAG